MKSFLFSFSLLAFVAAGSFAVVADECPIPAGLVTCKACHAVEPGKPSRVTGPSLVGLVGQPAMHSADFKGYSPAMKAAQAKGLIWTDENLMAYLLGPKEFFATFNGEDLKNSMMFQIASEEKRQAALDGLKAIAACK